MTSQANVDGAPPMPCGLNVWTVPPSLRLARSVLRYRSARVVVLRTGPWYRRMILASSALL